MKHLPLAGLIPVIALLAMIGNLAAQPSDYCVFTYSGENRDRTINASGYIRVECGDELWHTAPFGNWGVTSNYGKVKDSNQFPGWKEGTATGSGEKIRQWNSCTSHPSWPQGDSDYYNAEGSTSQRTVLGTATHGSRQYRKPIPCQGSAFYPLPSATGCAAALSSWSAPENFMSLYELDWDGNDFVTTLYFPGTSVGLTCNYYGCSEKRSDWQDVSSSTDAYTGVDAQFRMKVSAAYEGGCTW